MRITFTLFFLFSCTTLVDRGPITRSTFKQYLSGACLAGEGKGRVEVGSDDFSFDYGSIFENQTWMLSVDVPLRGEEVLQVQKAGKGYLFEGSFYHLLAAGYEEMGRKKRHYKREYFPKFLQFMGQTIFLLKDFREKKPSWGKSYFDKRCGSAPVQNCTFRYKGRDIAVSSNSLRISKKLDNFSLVWNFRGFSDDLNGHFESSELVLQRGNDSVMGVSFYHDNCQSETTLL